MAAGTRKTGAPKKTKAKPVGAGKGTTSAASGRSARKPDRKAALVKPGKGAAARELPRGLAETAIEQPTKDALLALWKALTQEVKGKAGELPDDGDLNEFRKRLGRIRAALDELDAEASVSRPISDFLKDVGHGMLVAQRDLDDASSRYSALQPEHPTAYRIPKVSAELTLALSSSTSKGFNVLLLSRKEQQEQSQTQKISFEVVAAPSPFPPDVRLLDVAVAGLTLTDEKSRDDLRAALAAYLASHANQPAGLDSLTRDAAAFRDVVVLRRKDGYVLACGSLGPPFYDVTTQDRAITAVAAATPALGALTGWLADVLTLMRRLGRDVGRG